MSFSNFVVFVIICLALALFSSCTNITVNPPVPVETVPLLCEIDNDSMEYCFLVYTGDSSDNYLEVESFNSSWLQYHRFLAWTPTTEITILVCAYENGFDGGITHYSSSKIPKPVAYNWGEFKDDDDTLDNHDKIDRSSDVSEEVIQEAIELAEALGKGRRSSIVHGYTNGKGQIMYTLAPLKRLN